MSIMMGTGIGAYYYGINPAVSGESQAVENGDKTSGIGKEAGVGKTAPTECVTCKNRKYQDGSDETVSFKTPQRMDPGTAAVRVRGHEQEHVSNAYDKAFQKNGKVVNASVTIHTSICPECGRPYVSGGLTHTQIKYSNEENPYQKERKAQNADAYKGMNVNIAG